MFIVENEKEVALNRKCEQKLIDVEDQNKKLNENNNWDKYKLKLWSKQ